MKVLYDHQIFMLQRFGGISRYFYELMRHSAQLFDYLVSGAFALSHNEYIDALQLPREFPLNMQLTDAQKLILNYADALIKTKECDVIHPTYYDPYILRNKNKPLVITVHDMIHELFPEYFTEDKTTVPQKKQMIHAADHIIAISQNTKSDILKLYPEISENKISVVYHGAPTNTIDNKEKPCGNYILFTGQRWIYKNFYNFISAVAPLLIKYDLRLICTGTAFNQNEQELLKNLDIHDRTTCLFADDKTLTELYSAATAFVFPSIYEGFGLPILEAFSAGGGGGCPVLASNTSSFPEIGGDAVVYFDPHSIQDMRSSIERVISSPDLQKQLCQLGRTQLQKFSWRKCAKETADVYKKLV